MKYSIEGQTLTDIADAIREKTGDTAALTAAAMAEAIAGISGGGGLEYETGEWTPEEDVRRTEILFQNEHRLPPIFIGMAYCGPKEIVNYREELFVIFNNYTLFGTYTWEGSSASARDCLQIVDLYRATSSSSLVIMRRYARNYGDATGDETDASYVGYWCSKKNFHPYTGAANSFWKAGSLYKWIAVWAPEE